MSRLHERASAYEARLPRLEALIREHHAAVLRYAWRRAPRDSIDDVMADTFLVAWRRLDEVPVDARPWLIGVARNVIATHARTRRRLEALRGRLQLSYEPVCVSVDEPETAIAQAFERLPVRDREVLMLVVVEEMTAEEAAVALDGLPANTVRSRLRRAKRRLTRALAEIEREGAGCWPSDSLNVKENTP
jgi:RNA polymerase sigma-70 factor, ECF subfamily